MRREAEALRALDLALDVIVTSPLARARRTAELVADELGMRDRLVDDDRLAHGFDVRRLEQVLAAQGPAVSVMVVGHEPDFSAAVAELIGGGDIVHEEGRARARRRDRARSRRRTARVAAHAASPGEQMKTGGRSQVPVTGRGDAGASHRDRVAGRVRRRRRASRVATCDTFLDTPDRRLLAAGYYFRRRETGDGVRLTLKQLVTPTDGVMRREEIEALVAADVPVAEWPAGELRERVRRPHRR